MDETGTLLEGALQPQDSRNLAQKVGTKLLGEFKYANLRPADLESQGVIQGADFPTFIFKELGLDQSLVPEALEAVMAYLPPPVDTPVVEAAKHRRYFTKGEELELRRYACGDESQILAQIEAASGIGSLVAEILQRAQVVEVDEATSFDPQKIRDNPELLETMLLRHKPTVTKVNDLRCFALRVPRKKETNALGFVLSTLMPATLEQFVIVGDPDANSDLSEMVYANPQLLKYFLAHSLVDLQAQRVAQLREQLSKASGEKYGAIEREVGATNFPAQRHLFDLLRQDCQRAPLTLMKLTRGKEDVAFIEGTAPQRLNRVGVEAMTETYQVTPGNDDSVRFSWEMAEMVWETQAGKRVLVPQTKTVLVEARPNSKENSFEFRRVDGDSNQEWTSESQYSGPIFWIRNLFSSIQVVSIAQQIDHGEFLQEDIDHASKTLLKTRSSAEFFAKVRELGVAHYPSIEHLVNSNPKVKFVVDAFPLTIPPEVANQN